MDLATVADHVYGPFAIWRRNARVWLRLIGPALALNLGEPAIYLLGLGWGLGGLLGPVEGLDYMTFLASGIVASSAMSTASFEGLYSVYTRMDPQKTYDAILMTPLGLGDIVIGEMLWCATKSAVSGAAIVLVAWLIGAADGARALLAIPATFLAGLAFAGLALVVTARARGYDFFNYYVTLVITPMVVVCGVFYPVDQLPATLREVVAWLPLSHAVALVRPLMTGREITDSLLQILALCLWALASGALAYTLLKRRLLK